ncbi:hypothetical protein RKD52_000657 [Metabacillus sp. SLBN-84]
MTFELHTERARAQVDCDVVADVTTAYVSGFHAPYGQRQVN